MFVIRAWLNSANLLTHPTYVVIVYKSTHACMYSWKKDVIINAYFHFSCSDLVTGDGVRWGWHWFLWVRWVSELIQERLIWESQWLIALKHLRQILFPNTCPEQMCSFYAHSFRYIWAALYGSPPSWHSKLIHEKVIICCNIYYFMA